MADFFPAYLRICLRRIGILSIFLAVAAVGAFAQVPSCSLGTIVPVVASSGFAELLGTVVLTCTGGVSGATVRADIYIELNANISNRLDGAGLPLGLIATVDDGSGEAAVPFNRERVNSSGIFVDQVGYVVPTPSSKNVTIRISGIRGSIADLTGGTSSNPPVTALVRATGLNLLNPTPQLLALAGGPSLRSSVLNYGFSCAGSVLPQGTQFSFQQLLDAGTSANTVRVTEAYPNAFQARATGSDSGNRIIVRLSGYPAGVRVFVPDNVVGANGLSPTSAGALGTPPSPGAYTPGANQFLLVRVEGADANGAGGNLVAPAAGASSFTSVSELTITGGSAQAVYEVYDSDPGIIDTAQITFFTGSPSSVCLTAATLGAVFGPLSNVSIATPIDPVPRFQELVPERDCDLFADCGALNFPRLSVDKTALTLTASSQGNTQSDTIRIRNLGDGLLIYNLTVAYQSGSGWLTLSQTSGVNDATVAVTADPGLLEPGVYQATITLNAGTYGVINLPVTFNVGAQTVTIKGIVNSASYKKGPVVPGSIAALFGLNLGGQNVTVRVGKDIAQVFYAGPTQINFLVPSSASTALLQAGYINVIVNVDGATSNTYAMALTDNDPSVYNPGILNTENSTVNLPSAPANPSTAVAAFMTALSLPLTGTVTVNIGDKSGVVLYAGPAPTLVGLEQVNVVVPAGLTPVNGAVPFSVCVSRPAAQPPLCSVPINLYVK